MTQALRALIVFCSAGVAVYCALNVWRYLGLWAAASMPDRERLKIALVMNAATVYIAVYSGYARFNALRAEEPFTFRDVGTAVQVGFLVAIVAVATRAGKRLRKEGDP